MRPAVGVAFGGGSARGLAHIGVLRWFEQHRIPIDMAAGTSMGALVGGAFATGMDADALDALIASMNWDELFGASAFPFKNIRRKADARAFPSRIEFGFQRGLVPPPSLNNGEQVEWMLARLTAPYHDVESFDDLPTPFRTVALDLVTATEVVFDSGSLAQAMRASMSLPLIFPPVKADGRVLVDGGAVNNVPADVVRSMGADCVISINVGELGDAEAVADTLTGLAGATIDAMMRASTRRALEVTDFQLDVPLSDYGSLDWRRSAELIAEGYDAAEARRDELLVLALGEAEYAAWQAARQGRRRDVPTPTHINLEGLADADASRLAVTLARHVDVPLDFDAVETDLTVLAGLDRYHQVTWQLVRNGTGEYGLRVDGRSRSGAPPFMMLGLNLENTTSADFLISFRARYLAYGLGTSSSELRLDATVGSNPGTAFEFYQPLGSSPFFVAPQAGIVTSNFNIIADEAVIARYGQSVTQAAVVFGVNLGVVSDLRLSVSASHVDTEVDAGDPTLPAIDGQQLAADLTWRLDTQDSPVVASRGSLARVRLFHAFDNAEVIFNDERLNPAPSLTQLHGSMNHFWSVGDLGRVFVAGAGGTSFDEVALPPNRFTLGSPLRLGAYRQGELNGNHYYVVSSGYLRRLGRLPDFIGGPIFGGGWLEAGDAFDERTEATVRTIFSVAVVLDTLIGPVLFGGSGDFDGRWRTYINVGRIF